MSKIITQLDNYDQQLREYDRLQAELKFAKERLEHMTPEERHEIIVAGRHEAINHKPETVQELHQAVKAIYGYSIPVTSTHPDFHAPMEAFAALYFGTYENMVWLASRGSAKTLMSSIGANILNSSSPEFESIHAGGTRTQARVAAKYLANFYNTPPLDEYFDGRPGVFQAKWKNGALWEIITGSYGGVSGQHPMMLTLDEIEVWEIEALMQTFEVPLSRKGYRRRWAAFSTRQRSFGGMRWLVDEAPKRNFQLFQWTMFETMQPCITCAAIDQEPHGNDMAREKVCCLWEHCKGERAKKASGWLSLKEAQDKCIRLGGPRGREFLTQGVCTRPSSHGLVLHNLEKLNKPEGNYTRWTFIKDLPWYAVHDPAEGKKSVILFIQRHEGCSYIFDELVNPTCATTNQAKQEFHEHCVKMGYGDPAKVIVDPHRTDAVSDWRTGSKSGEGMFRKYNAETPNIEGPEKGGVTDKIDTTVEMLRKYICDGNGQRRFYYNKDYCPMLDRAVGEYHYPVDRNTNEILSDTPAKAYSDEIDPMRYWVMWLITRGGDHGLRILLM